MKKVAIGIYVKRRKRERELTDRETERERECVKGRAFEEREISSVQRSTA
jgi:hypothetical protein